MCWPDICRRDGVNTMQAEEVCVWKASREKIIRVA